MQSGDAETAIPLFDRVSAAARRTNDEDLLVLAGIGLGNCLIMLGDMAAALDSLDEAMLYVTAEVVAPQVAGLAYCSVISACMERSDLQRAAEWTRALAGWCDAQSGLVPYRGSARFTVQRSCTYWDRGPRRPKKPNALGIGWRPTA